MCVLRYPVASQGLVPRRLPPRGARILGAPASSGRPPPCSASRTPASVSEPGGLLACEVGLLSQGCLCFVAEGGDARCGRESQRRVRPGPRTHPPGPRAVTTCMGWPRGAWPHAPEQGPSPAGPPGGHPHGRGIWTGIWLWFWRDCRGRPAVPELVLPTLPCVLTAVDRGVRGPAVQRDPPWNRPALASGRRVPWAGASGARPGCRGPVLPGSRGGGQLQL